MLSLMVLKALKVCSHRELICAYSVAYNMLMYFKGFIFFFFLGGGFLTH